MKEDLRQIWQQPDKATATRVLEDWIRRAEASCIKGLQKFAATQARWRTAIVLHEAEYALVG
jgi:transposase